MAAINWEDIHSQDEIACKKCYYYNIELKEIKDVTENSVEGGAFSFVRGKHSKKIYKAFYHCPKCNVISSYLVN